MPWKSKGFVKRVQVEGSGNPKPDATGINMWFAIDLQWQDLEQSAHNPMEIVLILGFLIPQFLQEQLLGSVHGIIINSQIFLFFRNNHVIGCCFLVLCIYRYHEAYIKPLHDLFIYSSLPFDIFLDQLHLNNTSSTYWTLPWDDDQGKCKHWAV